MKKQHLLSCCAIALHELLRYYRNERSRAENKEVRHLYQQHIPTCTTSSSK